MAELMCWEAIRRAHDEELANDPMVIAMGEDIGVVGGTYKATLGLYEKYGEKRIIDTPISENGYTGLGIGASFLGVRPIIEIMSVNFSWLAMDQIFNTAAKVRYMSGGQLTAPIVVRSPGGTAHQLGSQHSARMEKVFMGIAGLRVVTPSSPRQAYGLLKSAVRCNDPVFINEHELMYNMKGEVPDEEYFHPLEGSEIVREGRDVTLFGYNISVHWCRQAAGLLSEHHGIEAEVIDVFDALYDVVLRQAPLEQTFVDRLNAANELLQPRISEAIKQLAEAQLQRRRFIEERRASKTHLR